MDDALGDGLVQHLLVPLLQPLRLGDLLVGRVAVEDVVVPFAGRTGPDVTRREPGRGGEKTIVAFMTWVKSVCFFMFLGNKINV